MARPRGAGRAAKNERQGPSALGSETALWQAADKLRIIMDAAIEVNLKRLRDGL
jgi:hypothetical protein